MLVGRGEGGHFRAHGAEDLGSFHVTAAVKTFLKSHLPALLGADFLRLFPGLALEPGELIVNLHQGICNLINLLVDGGGIRLPQSGGFLVEAVEPVPLRAQLVDLLLVLLPVAHHERVDAGTLLTQFVHNAHQFAVGIASAIPSAEDVGEPSLMILPGLLEGLAEGGDRFFSQQVNAAIGRLTALWSARLHPLQRLENDLPGRRSRLRRFLRTEGDGEHDHQNQENSEAHVLPGKGNGAARTGWMHADFRVLT